MHSNDKSKINELEEILSHLLKPIKDIPFSVVIKTLSNKAVIPIDTQSNSDSDLVGLISEGAKKVGAELLNNPIINKRVNEVGNKIEPIVQKALQGYGLEAEQPIGSLGKKNNTGYPDLIITDISGRKTYLEIKTYSSKTKFSSQRSFYVSPSNNFKVTEDARHLLLAFEMLESPSVEAKKLEYRATHFKLVDLSSLRCDVKNEFQSDNKRMYSNCYMIAEGSFS